MQQHYFDRLVEIMQKLRSENGCPWDREQTWQTLCPYIIEEAYELVNEITNEDVRGVLEECGDVLLQVVFVSQIASENNFFDIKDVINNLCDKLIRRHPHVFGDLKVDTPKEVSINWEKIKKNEKKQKDTSILGNVPKVLPALIYAYLIQERAAKVGFDWENAEEAFKKVKEEIAEFQKLLVSGASKELIEEEIGDILFAVINVARLLGIHPEMALRKTNEKFYRRFRYIEKKASEANKQLESMDLKEMDALWEEAKRLERSESESGKKKEEKRKEPYKQEAIQR